MLTQKNPQRIHKQGCDSFIIYRGNRWNSLPAVVPYITSSSDFYFTLTELATHLAIVFLILVLLWALYCGVGHPFTSLMPLHRMFNMWTHKCAFLYDAASKRASVFVPKLQD